MSQLQTTPIPKIDSLDVAKRQSSRLVDVADASVGSLRRAIEAWLLTLRDVPIRELQSGASAQLSRAITGAGLKANQNSVQDVFARIVNAGAQYGLERLARVSVRKESVAAAMSFTMLNPTVETFIRGYMLDLVTAVSLDTRYMISAVILNAFRQGGGPREQARKIQPLIGLTSRQATAVMNYRAMLETGNYRATLDRALRDGRYDASVIRALNDGSKIPRAKIDQMVKRYAERSLRSRAENIARTESIRAANAGLRESWRQAAEQGLLHTSLRQHWLVATDERTCPNCKQIPGMNPNGVAIGGQFNTPYGPIEQPPAHSSCRCAMGLK